MENAPLLPVATVLYLAPALRVWLDLTTTGRVILFS